MYWFSYMCTHVAKPVHISQPLTNYLSNFAYILPMGPSNLLHLTSVGI